ncbi:MAG TPA: PRC-barrel domain-containing protein [Thermoleophilaceae bacterium]|nr:PRC-barrel domain-containing protein [Thermoleophilaceae bacterium]
MHSLEEARGWIEARVDDVYGSRVGQIADVYFDPEEREVHWILARLGSSEGPLTAIPVHYSIASRTHVWVPITKDLIARAPQLQRIRALTRDDELELCFHYGGLRRRAEVLRHRLAESFTAVPSSSVVPFQPRGSG